MKSKWYYSSLLIILTFLGAVFQQQTAIPNQEIVLQFETTEVTSIEAENASQIVLEQLELLGAENIQIKEEGSLLKISYFSTTNVSDIKKVLSELSDVNITSDSSDDEFPSRKRIVDYDFDIYEIQSGFDFDANTDGFVLEPVPIDLGTESDSVFNPDVSVAINSALIRDDITCKEAYKINSQIAIAIDHITYKIPEVRAGPAC